MSETLLKDKMDNKENNYKKISLEDIELLSKLAYDKAKLLEKSNLTNDDKIELQNLKTEIENLTKRIFYN